MGSFLSIPCSLQYQLNGLSGNAFKIYLLFLGCVKFQPNSRRPVGKSDFFAYPYSKAKKHGYIQNKMHFSRGVKELVAKQYVKIVSAGYFQGKHDSRKQNKYRLLRF